MRNTKLLVSGLALAAIGGGITACSPSLTSASGQRVAPATSAPGDAGGSALGEGAPMTAGVTTGPGRYVLQSMPAGTVWISRGTQGHLQARVQVFGLTPGSSHQVSIDGPFPVRFSPLTANSAGVADTTLTSVSDRFLPPAGRFVIRLGSAGDALAAEPIAETGVVRPGIALTLHAVTAGVGRPAGRTVISYNAAAQTLTVTLTAFGLNPGAHAAHIHLGSCRFQGPVKYMLADFVADARGDIIDQTRVVTGVTSVPGPGAWYLNLHMGGMNQILAAGAPTLAFRPMLCTDLTSFAVTATPAGTPTMTMPTSTPTMTMPASTPTPVMPTSTPTTMPTGTPSTMPTGTPSTPAMPTSTPSVNPSTQPTHY